MFNKNDPLLDSVAQVMKENQARREAVQAINEAFGITDKRHLPFQAHAEYDALVEEMTKEALVGGQHKLDVNRNNRLDKQDFKMLRGMKKKPMEEESEIAKASQNLAKQIPGAVASLNKAQDVGRKVERSLNNMETGYLARKRDTGGESIRAVSQRPKLFPENAEETAKSVKTAANVQNSNKDMCEETVEEATLSAKAARAGKDIGKKGKMFAKIAASAAKRYGSEERGKKVAGAILKKMRAKAGMEESTNIDSIMEEIRNNLNENAYYVINNLEEADQIAYFESLTEEQLGLLDEGVMDYIGTKLGQAGSAVYNKAKEIGGKVAGAAQAAGSAIDKQLTSPIGRLSPIGAMYSGAKGLAGAIGSGISAVKKDYQSYETGKKFAAAPDREGVRPGPGGKTDSSAVRMGGAPGAAADAARPAAPKVASQAAVASGTSSVPAPKPKPKPLAPKPAAGVTPPATGSIVKNRFGGLTRQNFSAGTTPGGGRNPLGGK